ncbi:MAG: outer membrane beta-barrel protein [Segetibacter sp.]
MRYFHNFYGIFQFSKKWSVIAGFDIGAEQKSKGSSQMNIWYSPVVIAKYNASGKLSLSARAEYYRDKNGVIISTTTSTGFETFGYSVNIDYAIQKNVLWRMEARTLNSKYDIPASNSTWLTSSLSVVFLKSILINNYFGLPFS